MKTIKNLREAITNEKANSAWKRGVKGYALEMLEDMADGAEFWGSPADKKCLLNGASDWIQASWGGCYEIYDTDITERLCTPSELKRNKHGELNPNSNEEWLDVQAKALHQACNLIIRLAK